MYLLKTAIIIVKISIFTGADLKYSNITPGFFINRPNRFIAHIEVNGEIETVHVKNTGRGKELLVPGAEVYLTEPGTPGRKTRYDLVTVRKNTGMLVNYDSQAPNKVAAEWLAGQGFDKVIPEFTYGDSRIDFYMERGNQKFLMEIKGCTLEIDGVGYFPDAPTERGVKHLHELVKAQKDGFHTFLAFTIQMDGITEVKPNITTHPEFGAALEKAKAAGVQILMLPCSIEPDSITVLPNQNLQLR